MIEVVREQKFLDPLVAHIGDVDEAFVSIDIEGPYSEIVPCVNDGHGAKT